eukprot:COSAG04_NODE_451_length_14146_cov_611.491920_7_plen_84_part_00
MHARGSAGMEKRNFQLCTLRGNFHKAVFVFVVAGGLGDPAERGGRQTVLCERGDGRLAVGAAFSLVAANIASSHSAPPLPVQL